MTTHHNYIISISCHAIIIELIYANLFLKNIYFVDAIYYNSAVTIS